MECWAEDFWTDADFEQWLLARTASASAPYFVQRRSCRWLVVDPLAQIEAAPGWPGDPCRAVLDDRLGLVAREPLYCAVMTILTKERLFDEALLDAGLLDAFQRLAAAHPSSKAERIASTCTTSDCVAIPNASSLASTSEVADHAIEPMMSPSRAEGQPSVSAATPSVIVPAVPDCKGNQTVDFAPGQRSIANAGKLSRAPTDGAVPERIDERRQPPTKLADLERRTPSVRRSKRIVQVGGVLGPLGGEPATHLREARKVILDWVAERGVTVPAKAFEGEPFDRDITQTRHPLTVSSTDGCWAMQFDTMPEQAGETIWRTEVVLLKTRERAQLGLGLTAIDSKGADGIRHTSIPNVIRKLAATVGLFDEGRLLETRPIATVSAHDVDRVIELIESPKRTRAVVAITRDASGRSLLNTSNLAMRLAGVAHVVDMEGEASWELTHRYGQPLSVFGLAIRLYRPKFDPDVDSPTRHPLFVGERWLDRQSALRDRIVELSAEETTRGGHDAVPTFTAVRRWIEEQKLEDARRAASTPNERLVVMAQENARLQAEYGVSAELLHEAESEREAALARSEDHRELARQLRERVRWLEDRVASLAAARGGDDTPDELPDSWEGMEQWAERSLGGRVQLLPAALRAARKSVFKDISFVYEVLQMLGKYYQPMREARTEDARSAFEDVCEKLHVEVSEVGEAATNHRTAAQYRATWKGERTTLDMHVSGSSSRRKERGFRLYFFYDEEDEVVVVGHFPEHLSNSLS